MVKFSPEPSMVASSLLSVVCVPASWSGVRRPGMTWCVSTAVSWALSASNPLRAWAGTGSKAGLAGASTVMSCVVLSVSTRLAAVTACTSVDSTGLLPAAVATGAEAIPVKLPAPSVGTSEQPAPNGSSDVGMALVPAASPEPWLEPALVFEDALLPDVSPEPQALSVRARVEAAPMRTPRVMRVLFTVMVLLVLSVRPHCRGRGGAPAGGAVRSRVSAAGAGARGGGRGGGVRSAGDHVDAVPAAGPGGEGGGPGAGLHLAVGAGRADGDRVPAGPEVVRQHPLAPQVGVDLRGQLRVDPVLVDLDLDPRDTARLGPGHAGDGPPAGAELAQRGRGVDPGGELD